MEFWLRSLLLGIRPTGRVKPDVVAVGLGSDVMGTDGNLRHANGTSFSSPIMCGMVACLWQACPELTAKEIIELVRRSGDRQFSPIIYMDTAFLICGKLINLR